MHCGVQEFTAPNGTVIFPQWMMDNLGVLNGKGMMGDMVSVASDLAAITPSTGGGAIEEWCPGVTSERGFVTMGFVGEVE